MIAQMMRPLAMVCTVLLAGCGIIPPKEVPPVVQRVEIPIPTPCKISAPEKPAFAVDSLPIGSGIWDQMRALRAERLQRVGYESELEAAIKACQ